MYSILKSLQLAGVEWELCDNAQLVQSVRQSPHTHVTPAQAGVHCGQNDSNFEINNCLQAMDPGLRRGDGCVKPIPISKVLSTNEIKSRGQELAAKVKNGELTIENAIREFTEHPLAAGAKNIVLPQISNAPKLVVITDIPSLSDDATGQILSGADGELFDKMMTAIGLTRADITILPLVFWRPAGGRTPTADELDAAEPLVQCLMLNAQCLILTLGKLAAERIFGAKLPGDHGRTFDRGIPIYKPDFIAANPGVKQAVWNALKKIANC